MANTKVETDHTIAYTVIDTDEDLDQFYIKSIILKPGAVDDVVVFNDIFGDPASAPPKFPLVSSDGSSQIVYVEQNVKLQLDTSETTLTAGGAVIINKGY